MKTEALLLKTECEAEYGWPVEEPKTVIADHYNLTHVSATRLHGGLDTTSQVKSK